MVELFKILKFILKESDSDSLVGVCFDSNKNAQYADLKCFKSGLQRQNLEPVTKRH